MSIRRDRNAKRAKRRRFFPSPVAHRGFPWEAIVGAAGVAFVFVVLVICVSVMDRQKETGFMTADPLPGGADIHLSAKQFRDGRAHFYRYATAGGHEVRFFVVHTNGVVRVAFDACERCYKYHRGYRQSGDVMVCNNCGLTLPLTRVGIAHGGCNPAALDSPTDGDQILIKAASLERGVAYF